MVCFVSVGHPQIRELKSVAKIFSNRKCSLRRTPLELPSVHFMNGESYNLDALGPEAECPALAPKKAQMAQIKQQLQVHPTAHAARHMSCVLSPPASSSSGSERLNFSPAATRYR